MCQLSEAHAWAAQAIGFGNSATGGCVAARLILSSELGVEVWGWGLTQNRGLGKDTFRLMEHRRRTAFRMLVYRKC